MRGIESPSRYLVKLGISRPTISRLMNGEKSGVSYGHLEHLITKIFELQSNGI